MDIMRIIGYAHIVVISKSVIEVIMQVMTLHKWFDEDVEQVLWEGHINNREIVLRDKTEALLINKEDVIALAKEFGLVVYEAGSNL